MSESYCTDCGSRWGTLHRSDCATFERDPVPSMKEINDALESWPEARMDALGQNGNEGSHYAPQSAAAHASNQPKDAINPSHYQAGKVECIDALDSATVNKAGIEAVCTANVIKYLWRYEAKNGLQDVKKARWYLERLIGELEQ